MEAYPKPRHQYIYTPRYGQRGFLSYAGQQPNGAPPTGVIPNGGVGVGVGIGYGGVGVGVGVAAGGYYPPPAVPPHPSLPPANAQLRAAPHSPRRPGSTLFAGNTARSAPRRAGPMRPRRTTGAASACSGSMRRD